MVMASRDRSAKANRDLRWTTESCAQGEASGFGHLQSVTDQRKPPSERLLYLEISRLANSHNSAGAVVQLMPIERLQPRYCCRSSRFESERPFASAAACLCKAIDSMSHRQHSVKVVTSTSLLPSTCGIASALRLINSTGRCGRATATPSWRGLLAKGRGAARAVAALPCSGAT